MFAGRRFTGTSSCSTLPLIYPFFLTTLLQIDVLASKQSVHARASKLPKPADIYAKFSAAYKSDKSTCDPTAIELPRDGSDILGQSCTVSFDCKSNDNAVDILKLLENQLPNFAKSDAYKETQEQAGDCIPSPAGMCTPDSATYAFREMPAMTSLSAKSIPPIGSGRYGAEVAHIKTTISCPEPETFNGICGALGGLFSLGTAIPVPGPAAVSVFGGVLVSAGCAIAGQR
jgi:hypothetical protein